MFLCGEFMNRIVSESDVTVCVPRYAYKFSAGGGLTYSKLSAYQYRYSSSLLHKRKSHFAETNKNQFICKLKEGYLQVREKASLRLVARTHTQTHRITQCEYYTEKVR